MEQFGSGGGGGANERKKHPPSQETGSGMERAGTGLMSHILYGISMALRESTINVFAGFFNHSIKS